MGQKEIWQNDDELFALIKEELFTAVIGDVMDTMGYLHQFLPPELKPLREDFKIAGRAMPVLEADSYELISTSGQNPSLEYPFGKMLHALDDLQKNEVYICTGASPNYALWGELMSTRALQLGAAGAVVNGYSRDTRGVLKLNFPTFSYGRYAQDQGPRGKVIDFRCRIKMGGVTIDPGDIVVGDLDGVCIIPQAIEREVIQGALEKTRGEKLVQKAIFEGMSAVDAFNTFGIM